MKPFIAPILALTLAGTFPAAAEVVHDASPGLKSVEFLAGWRLPDGRRMAAARIRLEDGWKTYWRAPGSIGIPASFDWTGSKNLSEVRFHWPTPTVYRDDGLITIGYKHELVLPIELTAPDPGQPIVINSTVEFAICDDVCLPASARISAVLTPDAEVEKAAISAALDAAPVTADQAGIAQISCGIAPVDDGFAITAHFTTRNALSDKVLTVFEYPQSDVWIDGTTTAHSGNQVTVTSMLYSYSETPLVLDRSKMRLTVLDQGRAVDIQGCPAF
jgi:DsbC/DsbD-like thiol-disulfide interchange protein